MTLTAPLAEDAAVQEYATPTQTPGVYQLTGALPGRFPFSSEFAAGATVPIRVTNGDKTPSDAEISVATYNAAGSRVPNTLTVSTVTASTNGGALVHWTGSTRLIIRALAAGGGLPLCATAPTDGQILVWDAMTSKWCPADLCTLVAACLPGAVFFDGSSKLWNFPAMTDSPTGTMSMWLYLTGGAQINSSATASGSGPDGDLFNRNASNVALIGGPNGGDPIFMYGTSAPAVSTISNATQAVITFATTHTIPVGAWLGFHLFPPSWAAFVVSPLQIIAATSMTATVNFDTTGLPAYAGGQFFVLSAMSLYVNNDSGGILEQVYHTPFPHDRWFNLLMSWDTNFSAGNKIFSVYVDDTLLTPYQVTDADAAFDIGYGSTVATDGQYAIGGLTFDESGSLQCYMAEYWFAAGQYLDLSNSANRAKFHAGGRPVNLGSDGSLPLSGVAPTLYLHVDRSPVDPYAALHSELKGLRVCDPTNNSVLANIPTTVTTVMTPAVLANGITSSHTLTASFWMWGGYWGTLFDMDNQITIAITGAPPTNTVTVTLWSDNTFTNQFSFTFSVPVAGLVNARFAVDTNHIIGSKIVHCYANNSDVSGSLVINADTQDNMPVTWTGSQMTMFGGVQRFGWLSEVWVAPDQFIDPGGYFIDGSGNPVSLGSNGQLVTGTAPSMYFTLTSGQSEDQFFVNRGSGGAFLETGGPGRLLPSGTPFLINRAQPGNVLNYVYPDTDLPFTNFDLAPVSP
jgi:hypothetical protein